MKNLFNVIILIGRGAVDRQTSGLSAETIAPYTDHPYAAFGSLTRASIMIATIVSPREM
jgi:hypothetical protein